MSRIFFFSITFFIFQDFAMTQPRNIYYVSGNTGILAKDMGKAILCQFPGTTFKEQTIPFVRSREDALLARSKILSETNNAIVFSTLLSKTLNELFYAPEIHLLTILGDHITKTETILKEKALWETGYSRHDTDLINRRVNAIHYSISHDDGNLLSDYGDADLILVGISRSGKTPVSIYLATQMGIKTANYPLVGEDLLYGMLPDTVVNNLEKVIGLTMNAGILHSFREKRFPGSEYARLETCRKEISRANALFESHKVPVVFSDRYSLEETATQVTRKRKLTAWPFI
jgi:regulator of PEP synthase PpsR (kinase-PPPase family)